MSLIVDNELAQYVDIWRQKFHQGTLNRAQIVTETASYGHETRRIPDSYYLLIDQKTGKLIAPSTGQPVENYIEKESYIGQLEFEGFRKTQNWAEVTSYNSVSVWFSPPLPGTHNVSKLIVSEKLQLENDAAVLNHAMLFDATLDECVQIVQSFAQRCAIDPNLFNLPDIIRANPVMLGCDLTTCISILMGIIKDSENWETVVTGESLRTKMRSLHTADWFFDNYIVGNSDGSGNNDELFGQHQGSCPVTAFAMLFEGARRFLCCTCPFCYLFVEAPIVNGRIYCPECKKSVIWNN